MAEYHVGAGLFSIYAGRISKDKKRWLEKTDVKDEALSAVALYLLDSKKVFKFELDGKKYTLLVEEDK